MYIPDPKSLELSQS